MLVELRDDVRQLWTLRDELTKNDQRTVNTSDSVVVDSRVDLELYIRSQFLLVSGIRRAADRVVASHGGGIDSKGLGSGSCQRGAQRGLRDEIGGSAVPHGPTFWGRRWEEEPWCSSFGGQRGGLERIGGG